MKLENTNCKNNKSASAKKSFQVTLAAKTRFKINRFIFLIILCQKKIKRTLLLIGQDFYTKSRSGTSMYFIKINLP